MDELSGAVVLVTGVMAAGKSTVAQALAERLPRAAHVHGDAFRRMVVSGRVEPSAGLTEEALRQLRLRYRLAAQVADGYAEAGFTAVWQDIVLGPMLAEMTDQLRSRPRYVVVLSPRSEVVAARETARAKTGYTDQAQLVELDEALRHETPRLGLWIDSSELTVDETVDAILADLATARLDVPMNTG